MCHVPYTYLIGWSKLNKFYYGVRYAKNCNPSDLWITYFTSSKHVKYHRELFGDPDIIQIRRKFSSPEKAKAWEEKVLRKLNVITDKRFLNKNVNGKFLKSGPQTKDHIQKRIKSTIETKRKKGSFKLSEEHKRNISNSTKGVSKPFREEHKKSIQKRIKQFNLLEIECPHCLKIGQYTNMKRWHFDNCKQNPNRIKC